MIRVLTRCRRLYDSEHEINLHDAFGDDQTVPCPLENPRRCGLVLGSPDSVA